MIYRDNNIELKYRLIDEQLKSKWYFPIELHICNYFVRQCETTKTL